MTSLIERITKLIALAASPVTEEARTSAFLACKLIRENGLRVTDDAEEAHVELPPAYRRIVARYLSGCPLCSRRISVGQHCYWAPGKSAICVACHEQEVAA